MEMGEMQNAVVKRPFLPDGKLEFNFLIHKYRKELLGRSKTLKRGIKPFPFGLTIHYHNDIVDVSTI